MPAVDAQRCSALAAIFLKIGALSYGGAATMGVMHAEVVDKKQWLSNDRYLEGLGLVNVLPGPPAVQLAVFIGYERAGWVGGVLAGLCFMLPAFFILLGLTLLYSSYGQVAVVRDALGGISAVVIAIFGAAVYRLGKTALQAPAQVAVAVLAATLLATTPFGVAPILLLSGSLGVLLYYSRLRGSIAAAAVLTFWAIAYFAPPLFGPAPIPGAAGTAASPSIFDLAAFFLKVSALTFGGGMTIVAFVQEHVVNRAQWLTSREFLDGLALGQMTPGPTLMIAAYVGYKLAGLSGAIVSALCIFAPAFFLVLPLMPLLDKLKRLRWINAAMRGISPAVIGCLVVTLAQLLPHAVPDAFAGTILLLGAVAIAVWKVSPLPLILGAGVFRAVATKLPL